APTRLFCVQIVKGCCANYEPGGREFESLRARQFSEGPFRSHGLGGLNRSAKHLSLFLAQEVSRMRPGRHSTVTGAQREELWRRDQAGEAVLWISRDLGQRASNLYRVLQAPGGIEPPPRTRSPRVLSLGEREEISRGIASGDTFRAITRRLNRAISTVSQEV